MAKKLPVDHTPICESADIRRIDPIWVDKAVPRGFWRQPQNRRDYLLWLGGKLGFCRMSDWYRLTYQDMAKHHGSGLANIWWHSSPVEAVQKCFPAYDWEEWQFVQVPMAFWTTAHNRRRYMAWLGRQLGFRQAEDWYRVTTVDFQRHRGGTLLLRYRSSVSATVKACFPDYDWKEWLFGMLPAGFWDEPRHCRRYMRWLGKRLGYRRLDDWYQIKLSHFLENGGSTLVRRYGDSPSAAVIALVPRSEWHEWLFGRVPLGFWDRSENRERYLTWLGKRLGYRSVEDWMRIRRKDFWANFGASLIARYRSYEDLLAECIPQWHRQPHHGTTLTIKQILAGADAHFAAHGEWPAVATVEPVAEANATWRDIDVALRRGLRGLPGGTSLARLLQKLRGKQVVKRPYYPPLSAQQIVDWQKSYRQATGHWPVESSGPITEAPEETWLTVSRALQYGNRGLPGGSGLAKLRAQHGLR